MAYPACSIHRPAWSYDPWLLAPLYLVGIAFYVGTQTDLERAGFGRGVRVSAGRRVLDRLAGARACDHVSAALARRAPFSAHMIEHELIMLVAAPLMAYARINGALLWSLPRQYRPVAGRLLTRGPVARQLARPQPSRHRNGSCTG